MAEADTGKAIRPVVCRQADIGSLQNHVWVMDMFFKLQICKPFTHVVRAGKLQFNGR